MDSLQASRISGGNSANGRRSGDFYPTPPEVTVALMDFLNLPSNTIIWEPAAGEGDMAGVLMTFCDEVYATDIIDGTDFLQSSIDAAGQAFCHAAEIPVLARNKAEGVV